MAEKHKFSVGIGENGYRLDQFLVEKLENSRNFCARHIKTGNVFVNNKPATKPSFTLKTDDSVRIVLADRPDELLKAESVPLKIYFEDEHLLVLEKPAGVLVHPAGKRVTGTLVNALMAHFDADFGESGSKRPGIVHRLDEDTSGLLIVAKTRESHRALTDMFAERKIVKKYLTLVEGKLTPKSGSIDAPLKRSNDTRMRVSGSSLAKVALTHYEVISYPMDRFSYLSVRIETGRTHQIRVHLCAINHPVVGDKQYGFPSTNEYFSEDFGLKRHFLHAAELEFTHPMTDEAMHFESPLPEDLASVLAKLRMM
jgi:23S rRNA pseudouridine1911/1915/1917 synthase